MRKPNALALLVLSIGLTLNPVAADEPSTPTLRLTWDDTRADAPRCKTLDLPSAGWWYVETRTAQPSTAPGFVVLQAGLDEAPRFVERLEAQFLEMRRPGEHLVCLTSQVALGTVEVTAALLKPSTKDDGDPDETEVELP